MNVPNSFKITYRLFRGDTSDPDSSFTSFTDPSFMTPVLRHTCKPSGDPELEHNTQRMFEVKNAKLDTVIRYEDVKVWRATG